MAAASLDPNVGHMVPFPGIDNLPVFQVPTDCTFPNFIIRPDGKPPLRYCPDLNLSLEQRRQLVTQFMGPLDEINGVKLDRIQKAKAAKTTMYGQNQNPNATTAFKYQGTQYVAYVVERDTGFRAPIHYHEVPQMLCLLEGTVEVWMEGAATKNYTAPDCYMMPAYTKVCPLTIKKKIEFAYLRIPQKGLDWVVIEEQYYAQQGQWADKLHEQIMNPEYGGGIVPVNPKVPIMRR